MSTVNVTDDAAAGFAVGLGVVFFILFSIVGLFLYILPGIIASVRRHPQALPIWLVTLFLGFTGIGWLAALIWSFITPERPMVMAAPMAMPPQPGFQPVAPVAVPTPGPAPTASSAMVDEIAALARLRDQGVLTEAEFTARKHLLLGEAAPAGTVAPPAAAGTAPPLPAASPEAAPEAPAVVAAAEPPHTPPEAPLADLL